MAERSRRFTRSSHVRITSLTDDLQAIVFGFLPTRDLLRSASVCRLWRKVLRNAGPVTFEGALFELDPLAILGTTGVAASLKAGVNTLDLLHRLGNSACGQCKRRGALFFDTASSTRVCNKCPFRRGSSPASCLLLTNRYFHVRPKEKAAIKVSSAQELRSAVKNLKMGADERYLNTIVLTKDIDLTAGVDGDNPLVVIGSVRLCGEREGIRLRNRIGPALLCCIDVIAEDLHLVSGLEGWMDDPMVGDGALEMAHYPCVQLMRQANAQPGINLRNCNIQAFQGSAVMNDSGRLSMDGCSVASYFYYGLINKTSAEVQNPRPPFLASVCGCSFTDSMWHISAGKGLSAADKKALLAAGNSFVDGEFSSQDIESNSTAEYSTGVLQPWRRGALAAALRASVLARK